MSGLKFYIIKCLNLFFFEKKLTLVSNFIKSEILNKKA